MRSGLVLIVLALLSGYNGASAAEAVDWWEWGTLYHVYPRSFMDSNGDGVGDLNGITSRLEYFKEIGVTAFWMSPINESPMVDMGYDISNFTDIDPLFGTLDDFDAMVAKAHKLGLKVILDFVPNHTSDKHEWFQKSIHREPGFEDFYMWDDGKINPETNERIPPSNWRSVFGGSAWTWVEERQQYYLHQFYAQQPDLNLTNPRVRAHLVEVMDFWLRRDVDAFRIDAVPFFVEKRFENGTYPDQPLDSIIYTQNQPESIDLLYEWREYLDKYTATHGGDTRAMISEAYAPVLVLSEYITNGTHKGNHMPMNFNFVKNLTASSTAKDVERELRDWMDVIWANHKVSNYVASNHDNARLTTRMGYNRADIMTMIIHAMPGASVTYYGEEIGMTDLEFNCVGPKCNFRDPERTPMQWDTSKNAGFNNINFTWLAVNPNYEFINVKTERGVARSSLQIFKGMTKLKHSPAFMAFKEDGAFDYGALKDNVFQVVRTNNINEEYRVLANLGNQIEYVEGLTNKTMEYVLLNSYSPHKYGDKVDLSKRIFLMPFEGVVLRWSA